MENGFLYMRNGKCLIWKPSWDLILCLAACPLSISGYRVYLNLLQPIYDMNFFLMEWEKMFFYVLKYCKQNSVVNGKYFHVIDLKNRPLLCCQVDFFYMFNVLPLIAICGPNANLEPFCMVVTVC